LILGIPLKIYVPKPLFFSREIDNHVWFDVCTATATVTGAVAGAESTIYPAPENHISE
jgi:hypothetical protein